MSPKVDTSWLLLIGAFLNIFGIHVRFIKGSISNFIGFIFFLLLNCSAILRFSRGFSLELPQYSNSILHKDIGWAWLYDHYLEHVLLSVYIEHIDISHILDNRAHIWDYVFYNYPMYWLGLCLKVDASTWVWFYDGHCSILHKNIISQ